MTQVQSRFRKKAVVIDAWRVVAGRPQPEWLLAAMEKGLVRPSAAGGATDGSSTLDIHTLEGVMRADLGDWIIRGVKGEVYPCKPDIFAATYDPADEK
jgi:hypothetical protein